MKVFLPDRELADLVLITFLKNSGQNDAEIMNAIIKVYDVSVIEAESYL